MYKIYFMKRLYAKINIKRMLAFSLVAVMAGLSLNYASGPGNTGGASYVNSPFSSGSCSNTGCHSGGNFSPSVSVQLLSGTTPVTTYASNTNYTVRITISASNTTSSTRYGFQAVSVQTGSPYTGVNNWGTLPSNTQTYTTGGRTHVEHSTRLNTNVINIPWTSPNTSTGSITFYVAGNVVNSNSSQSGDSPAFGSLTVTPPCNTPTMSTSVTNVTCKGGNDGAIMLTSTGGTAPVTYAWTGPNNYSSTSQNISGLQAGTYKVVATAAGGCKDSLINIAVSEPATGVVVNATSNSPVCEGGDIQLMATATGATGTPGYEWFGPNSYSSTSQNSTISNASSVNAGVYLVRVTDGGCTAEDTFSVVVNPKATVDTFNFTQGIGADSNIITFTSVNIQNATTVKWLFGDGDSVVGTNDPVHTYPASGTYTTLLIVTNSCGSDTITRTVNVDPVGIGSVVSVRNVVVYPNPARNMLYIKQSGNVNINAVTITDVTGRHIMQADISNNNEIDISGFSNGIYYLSMVTDNGVVLVEHITVQK